MEVQKLDEGVILIKNILSDDEQLQLWADIKSYREGYKATPARNAKSNFTKIMAVSSKKLKKPIPETFHSYSDRVANIAHTSSPTIPEKYGIDYITSFSYPVEGGKLVGHCDKVVGWVVLFSLGCSANFFVKTKNINKKFEFESGDALIFNGGSQYNVFHGITSIVPDSCPTHFMLEDDLQSNRVSIQFRQTVLNEHYYSSKK